MRNEEALPPNPAVARAIAASVLPDAVRTASLSDPPTVAPGQLWRARSGDVARFVLVLHVDVSAVDVAPLTTDVDSATDDAFILDGDATDFAVPTAVWLGLRTVVPIAVLDRFAGMLHIAVDAVRKQPVGRALVSVLEDRALETAVLGDDMDELASVLVAAATRTADLLASISLEEMTRIGMPAQLALAVRRGLRPVTREQAEVLAPLVPCTPEALLSGNPPLPVELERALDGDQGRLWVKQLAERRSSPMPDARLTVGYGAFALAARETDRGVVDWNARIAAYVQALVGEE